MPLSGTELGPTTSSSAPSTSAREPGGFQRALSRLGAEVDRGERMVQGILSGRAANLGAGELIAVQAGIYRYTEVVELSAKLIDRAATAVRTTLQSGT